MPQRPSSRIVAGGEVLGVIDVHVAPGHDCSESDLDRLRLVAGALGGVIRHRRAEQAKEAAERQRLQLAHQAGHVGAFDWDTESDRVVWTPELEALYGLAPGAFPGHFAA